MSLQTDGAELEGVFGKVVETANSIHAICSKKVYKLQISHLSLEGFYISHSYVMFA